MAHCRLLGHGGKKLLDRVPYDMMVKNEVSKTYFSGPLRLFVGLTALLL